MEETTDNEYSSNQTQPNIKADPVSWPGSALVVRSPIEVWSRIVFFLTTCKPAPCVIQIHNLGKTLESDFRVCFWNRSAFYVHSGSAQGSAWVFISGSAIADLKPTLSSHRNQTWGLGVCVLLGWVWSVQYWIDGCMYLYRHRVSFFKELFDDLETFPALAFYCLPIFFSTFNHKLIFHAAFWFKKILHPNWFLPFGFIVGKWKQETLVVFCSHGDIVLSHCHTHKGACRGQGGHQPTRGCFEYLKRYQKSWQNESVMTGE